MAALILSACATPKYATGKAGYAVSAHRNEHTLRGSTAPASGELDDRPRRQAAARDRSRYQVNGVWYYPKADSNYNEVGIGSWYGEQFHNRRTANGEIFDMDIHVGGP
ncbi:hypothetical protein ACRAWD_16395 [Caulobacter segnis]